MRYSTALRAAYAGLMGLLLSAALSAQESIACGMRGAERWQSTRPSPLDSVSVVLRDRIARICYSRPSARGRSVDSLVPLRRAWRTGANEPTTITLTSRLSIGGVVLDRGRYVLLTVPGQEQWRLVFNTTPDTEPARMFATLRQVALGTGQVETLTRSVEQFTIRAVVDSVAPEFLFEWGTWRVHVPVRLAP